ncbi:MAG: hypothetical protein MI810_11060 [Flavobacteriales bacterium]|jgi:hypothetical protein|nr:hypothetical protein [Flavobacteriales bacterium]
MRKCSEFDLFHESHFGYVSRCKNCNDIHVQIGSFLCALSEESFVGLCDEINRTKKEIADRVVKTPAGDKILLAVARYNLFLSLSPDELYETAEMLQIGKYMMEVDKIIQG